MPWVRIDEEFAKHPKVVAAGPLGMAMQVAALCYCNQYLTDGFVPRSVAAGLVHFEGLGMRMWMGELTGGGEDASWELVVDDLLEAKLWEEVPGGYRIHDYHDYQPSREAALALRAARSSAGSKGGKASAQAKAKQVLDQPSSNGPASAQAESKPVPVPVPVEELPPTAAADAARSDPPSLVVVDTPVTAQTLIAEHCDAVGQRPPGRELGQLARHIADMLREGIPPDLVRAGLDDYRASDLHPSVLPSLVAVRQRGGQPRTRPTRQQQDRDQLVETHRQLDAWAKEVDGHAGNGMDPDRRPAQRELPRPGAAG